MRPTIHPDRSELLIRAEILMNGDDFLCAGILFVPDSELQRPAIDVRKAVWLTLMLQQIHASHIESIGIAACRIVQWDAREIALNIAGNAIALIFVIAAGPLAFEVHLSEGGHAQ
jgi:hypothetical protein